MCDTVLTQSAIWVNSNDERIAYAKDGRLYVHALASGVAADLGAVSLSGRTLFWSPDSQTIGFVAESAIRTIPASGGTPFVACKIPGPVSQMLTGLWLPDDTILFSVWRDSIYRVPASGGTPELHVPLDPAKEVDAHFVTMAPGNRLVVGVHVRGQDDAQRLDIVENGRRTPLSSDKDMLVPALCPPEHSVVHPHTDRASGRVNCALASFHATAFRPARGCPHPSYGAG